MPNYSAQKIEYDSKGMLCVPPRPIIPYIEGDGVGPDIWNASVKVFDSAVAKAYSNARSIDWLELLSGEKARSNTGNWLPDETLEQLKDFKVGIKGPLSTPIGTGIRSLNVAIRQTLDLYACIRPVRYLQGLPSPIKHPEKVNMVVFRENTEDVYAGLEWPSGSDEVRRIIDFFQGTFKVHLRRDTAVGLKPMSPFNSKRLIRKAIQWAIEKSESSVTLVHKGNIMKFTEGAFRDWGYELASQEFADQTLLESQLHEAGTVPNGSILIKDRIADAMFQQVLLRPEEYSVLAMPNLNGDYLSDALSAQVGGLGMAPGANIGDEVAVFEATHGTAPKYAGKDLINPGSMLLSGALMFDHLQWPEAAECIRQALAATIQDKIVTYDLARQLDGAEQVKCSEFAQAVIEHM